MAKTGELKAALRPEVGKGAARAIRKKGDIPGVVYGDKKDPQPVTLVKADVLKFYNTGRFLSTVFNLEVDGKKQVVIPRDVQVDPVKDFVTHIDFLRVAPGAEVRVGVPVKFFNQDKSPGIKRGGALNIVRHSVEFYCKVDQIPDDIQVDLDGLEIGSSVHISAVKLPAGIRPVIHDRDFTIATIAGAVAETEVTATAGEETPDAAAAAAAPAADAKKDDGKKDK